MDGWMDGEERGDLTEVRKEKMEVLDLDKNEISAEAVESIRNELEEKGKSSMLGSLENNDDSYTSEDPEELKEFLWGVCWKRGWLNGWVDSRQECYKRENGRWVGTVYWDMKIHNVIHSKSIGNKRQENARKTTLSLNRNE